MGSSQLTAVGAYIFAGGFTLGMRRHFEILAHLEDSAYGVATARQNLHDLPIHVGADEWPLAELRRRRVDVVYGNPPCAAWSALNAKPTKREESWRVDGRVDCTRKHFNLLLELKPRVWVWESVQRAFTVGRPFVDELEVRAAMQGYSVTHLLFNGNQLGLPHRRLRYFFIAHREELNFDDYKPVAPPLPRALIIDRPLKPLADDSPVIEIPKRWRPAWKKAKGNENVANVWERMNPGFKLTTMASGRQQVVGRPGFIYYKLDLDQTPLTVVGLNLMHAIEPRYLSMPEMRRLCGYPDNFRLEESRGRVGSHRWDLFTRAVMPPIGDWLGKQLKRALSEPKKLRRPEVRIVRLTDKAEVEYVHP